MSGIPSGHTVRIGKRDVPYEGPFIRAEGREIPVATNGQPVTLPAAAPIAKRVPIRKGAPATFAQAMAAEGITEWMPSALVTLRAVVDAAIAGAPNDPTITGEIRLDAVRGSLAEFSDALLVKVAAAIVGPAPAAAVAKRKPATWRGML